MTRTDLARVKRDRKAVSKRVRFEVFKRDGFTCQYCGATPPTVVLEVDHIEPVSLGGTNDEWNLLTSCFDCNRGKSDKPLSVLPESLAERRERLAEAEDQIQAYRELMERIREREEADIWTVIEALYGESETRQGRYDSVKRFLTYLPLHEVVEAAEIARAKFGGARRRRFSYFCGICWRKIERAE